MDTGIKDLVHKRVRHNRVILLTPLLFRTSYLVLTCLSSAETMQRELVD